MKEVTRTVAELIGGGGNELEIAGITAGIGGGAGASIAIEAAGGLGALSNLGAAAPGVLSAAFLGALSSGAAGYAVGTVVYVNVGPVREGAGAVMEVIGPGIKGVLDWMKGDEPRQPTPLDDIK